MNNKPNLRVACIVDGHSTGAELSNKLKELGWFLVHVQSGEEIPKSFAKNFRKSSFDTHILAAKSDYTEVVAQLKALNPEFVIAGSEPGVELSDRLAHSLGLEGNDPETSRKRRNKFSMSQAISECGLDSVKQYLATTEREVIESIKKLDRFPLVVKPVDAMGSEDVRVCFDEDDALDAFRNIHGKRNFIGAVNSSALIQEFLEGDQYVVNAVSINGKHRITEMWLEKRLNIRGVGNIYDYETMVPYQGKAQTQLIDYTKKVLTALGIEEGPSHTEIMLTHRGPILIETGARMQGGIVSAPIIKVIGDSHMTMTLKRYLDPQWFIENIHTEYEMSETSRVVNLIMKRPGTVKENNSEKLLSTLPSFHMIVRTPNVGDHVGKTVDLSSKVGHIYLMHKNVDQLNQDYNKIREWEDSEKLIILE